MSVQNSGRSSGCPVSAFQKLIGGEYKPRILWDPKNGHGEIGSGLLRATLTQEIGPGVLSRELKALAESGLLDRKDYGTVPPKVGYKLSPGRA